MQYVMDTYVTARRTRDAIKQIKTLEVSSMTRKHVLAAWFRDHTRAAPTPEEKRAAYDDLLGRARNATLRG